MIYQLKINLAYMKPPVWRRIEVSSDISLEDLHMIIQVIMDWENSHLHQFIVGNMFYMCPYEWNDDYQDYTGILLKDVLNKEKDKMMYKYDFGASWKHIILLEKIKEEEKGVKYPRCIKGKGACPPEDCGGNWDEEDMTPFDIDEVNKFLA